MSPSKSSAFDQSKAYAEQEDIFFDDGREIELLHYVYARPDINEIRGNPAKVLQAIDDFGRTEKYLMNVGEYKGKIVTDLISEVKPQTMVVTLKRSVSVRHWLIGEGRLSWVAISATPASSSARLYVRQVVNDTTVWSAIQSLGL